MREDQAAAALSVLTDGRRVSVIDAPAGSGKTWVLAEIGRVWDAAGLGRVIGITPSQSARNTLAAGVPESYNSAQFLGHLPGRRGARGPVRLRPGNLVLMDEASMVSSPDLADVIGQAAAAGAKVILAGDTQQLQAVENGGGMSLLAGALGDARLEAGEPGRTLANGDLLRIEAVTKAGLIVRRALDADPRTGQWRWTDQHFLYANYGDAELGYAVTNHVAKAAPCPPESP